MRLFLIERLHQTGFSRFLLTLALPLGFITMQPWLAGPSVAQTPPAAANVLPRVVSPLHPWQTPQISAKGAQAYFTNIKDGDTIETPYLLKFGLSGGWGLAPIAKPMGGKSGHHHLLVNRDLPLDFKKALPFDEQYIHFGKGQMQTVLSLAPGSYTLRMLLADDQHLPHFVYSDPVKITVSKKTDTKPESLVKKGVSIGIDELLDRSGDTTEVKPPFRLQMHASGLYVGHQAQQEPGTGHFKLAFYPANSKPGASPEGKPLAEMDFVNGETEVWLSPPAGDYLIKLDFIDNTALGKTLTEPAMQPLRVKSRA